MTAAGDTVASEHGSALVDAAADSDDDSTAARCCSRR